MGKEIKVIDYDSEKDILFISNDESVKSSIDIGNFVLDVNQNNFIGGIEILNASENLGIEKNILKRIKSIKMAVNYKTNNVYVLLAISFKQNNKEVNISVPLNIRLGNNKQPMKEVLECKC